MEYLPQSPLRVAPEPSSSHIALRDHAIHRVIHRCEGNARGTPHVSDRSHRGRRMPLLLLTLRPPPQSSLPLPISRGADGGSGSSGGACLRRSGGGAAEAEEGRGSEALLLVAVSGRHLIRRPRGGRGCQRVLLLRGGRRGLPKP